MTSLKELCIVYTIILLIISRMDAQYVSNIDPTKSAQLETIFAPYQLQLTGFSVVVIYDGSIAYANAYGEKNSNNDDFSVHTKSLLASISKTMTAVLAMRLVQEGHLGLNDAVTDYIQDERYSGMSIRHLLSHQSGIDHYGTCPGGYDGDFHAAASLAIVNGCTICMSPPGSGTLYTTYGSTLLGVVIDLIAQEEYSSSYVGLYETWIRGPGGLTTLEPASGNSDLQLAQGHSESGVAFPISFDDIGWKLPAGGFISNIIDLGRYGVGVLNNTFINQSTFNLMTAGETVSGGATFQCNGLDANNYGLGWRRNGSGLRYRIWHNGLNEYGYSSYMALYPGSKAGIVILANEGDEADVLGNMAATVESLILCPNDRNFTEDIDWTNPSNFTSGNIINLSMKMPAANSQFTFDGFEQVKFLPGTHLRQGSNVIAKTGGCVLGN